MSNLILKELEDLVDPGLPPEFTLWVPDAWMRGLLRAGMTMRGVLVPETVTRLLVRVLDYTITLRADSDPDSWAPLQ
jgi:hypothetical protein